MGETRAQPSAAGKGRWGHWMPPGRRILPLGWRKGAEISTVGGLVWVFFSPHLDLGCWADTSPRGRARLSRLMQRICRGASLPCVHSPASPTLRCWGHPARTGDAGDGSVSKEGSVLGAPGWRTAILPGNLSQKPSLGLHGQQHLRGFDEVASWRQGEGPGDLAAAKPEAEVSPDPTGSGCGHGLPGAAPRQAGRVCVSVSHLPSPALRPALEKSKKIQKKPLFERPLGPNPATIVTLPPKTIPGSGCPLAQHTAGTAVPRRHRRAQPALTWQSHPRGSRGYF